MLRGIFFIKDYWIVMDFADYFYHVNCITTMNFCCDAPFSFTMLVQASLNLLINPCNRT